MWSFLRKENWKVDFDRWRSQNIQDFRVRKAYFENDCYSSDQESEMIEKEDWRLKLICWVFVVNEKVSYEHTSDLDEDVIEWRVVDLHSLWVVVAVVMGALIVDHQSMMRVLVGRMKEGVVREEVFFLTLKQEIHWHCTVVHKSDCPLQAQSSGFQMEWLENWINSIKNLIWMTQS